MTERVCIQYGAEKGSGGPCKYLIKIIKKKFHPSNL